MKNNFLGVIAILLAATIWWSTGVFVKTLNLPAMHIVAFRLGVPLLFVVIYLLLQKKGFWLTKKAWIYSGWNAIRMLLYYIWFNLTTVANAVIWLYTWPLFATIIDYHRTKRISKINLICVLLGFVGIIVTCFDQTFSSSLVSMIGFGAITLSAMISAFQRFEQKNLMKSADNTQMILYQSLIWTLIFWPLLFITKPVPNLFQISMACVFAFLVGIVWFYLYFWWLRKISISYMSILSYFEIISSILFAYFVIGEIPW